VTFHSKNYKWAIKKLKWLPTDKDRLNHLFKMPFKKAMSIIDLYNDQSLAFHYFEKLKLLQEKITFLPIIKREEDLEFIARTDKFSEIRYSAMQRISSSILLKNILFQEQDGNNIYHAMNELISDSRLLLDLINHHQNNFFILKFINQMDKQDFLLKAACLALDNNYKEAAFDRLDLEKLNDESKLALLRTNKNDKQIYSIINALDTGTLAEIAKGSREQIVKGIHLFAKEKDIPQLITLTC